MPLVNLDDVFSKKLIFQSPIFKSNVTYRYYIWSLDQPNQTTDSVNYCQPSPLVKSHAVDGEGKSGNNSLRALVGSLSQYLQAFIHPRVLPFFPVDYYISRQKIWSFETCLKPPPWSSQENLSALLHLVGHPWIPFHRACHVQDRGLSSNVAVGWPKICIN